MSERREPLTLTVLYVSDKNKVWQNPLIWRLDVQYQTPTTVLCDPIKGAADYSLKPQPGRKGITKQQTAVYPIRDDATWDRVVVAHGALQQTLDDLAAGLRELGSYASRLAAAGKRPPNPLSPTVIACDDPDTGNHNFSWLSELVPRISRKPITEHTPKMLRGPSSYGNFDHTFHQRDHFVCPDDAAWERIQALHQTAEAAAKTWQELLKQELLTYAAAVQSDRYQRSWPVPPAGTFYGHHRQSSEYMHVWRPAPNARAKDRHVALCNVQPMQEVPKPANLQRANLVLCPDCRKALASLAPLPQLPGPEEVSAPLKVITSEPLAISGDVMMTRQEARACIDRIKASVENIRRDLLALHDQEGWAALGYDSWRTCVTVEFGQSESYLYRQLAAAELERDLGFAIGEMPESHLRPLTQLESTEDRRQALTRADELAGAASRQAKHVAQAVAEQRTPPLPDRETLEQAAQEGRVLDAAEAQLFLKLTDSDLASLLGPAGIAIGGARWTMDTLCWAVTVQTRLGERLVTKTLEGLRALVADRQALAPAPLPVVPSLDHDRIAALAARDIRYIDSPRANTAGKQLHRIRGPFGERLLTLDKIDEVIADTPVALVEPPAKLADAPPLTDEELAVLARDGWQLAGAGVSELGEAFVAMHRDGEIFSRTRVAWRWEIARIQDVPPEPQQSPPVPREPTWLEAIRAALRTLTTYPPPNPANPADLEAIERAARTIVQACEASRTERAA